MGLYPLSTAVFCAEILHVYGFDSIHDFHVRGAKSLNVQAAPRGIRPEGSFARETPAFTVAAPTPEVIAVVGAC